MKKRKHTKHHGQPKWFGLTDGQKTQKLQQRALPTERALAPLLTTRGILGWSFRWNERVAGYFPDFTCEPLALVIEIDGSSHEGRDAKRQAIIEGQGYVVHRLPSRMPIDDKLAAIEGFVRSRITALGMIPPLSLLEERAKHAAHRDLLAD